MSSAFRFVFCLPGALAGAGVVVAWAFLLDPAVSPYSTLLHLIVAHYTEQTGGDQPPSVDLCADGLLAGAGSWIVILHAG